MGDMPELLQYLITQGKAVLWSSQDISGCKVGLLLLYCCMNLMSMGVQDLVKFLGHNCTELFFQQA